MDDEQQRVEKYIYRRNRDAKKIRKLFLSSRKKPWKKRQKKDERMVFKQPITFQDFCKTVIYAANWQEERPEAA